MNLHSRDFVPGLVVTLSVMCTLVTLTTSPFALAQTQATPTSAARQATSNNADSCILAGRLDAQAKWSPALKNIELVDSKGQTIKMVASTPAKDALNKVKQVRVKTSSLLASCNGAQALIAGDDSYTAAMPKSKVPAVTAGAALIPVEGISFPSGNFNSTWVELKLQLTANRVTMITR